MIDVFHLPLPEACIDFINLCVCTYDPRKKDNKKLPFFLYERQKEFVYWIWEMYKTKQKGAVDKCRDVGASWVFCAMSVWMLIFIPNVSVGFYSLKAEAVDKNGEIDSLFEKVRFILKNLPEKIKISTENSSRLIKYKDSSISGLAGEEPRGGRKSILFKDETAFYEHAEKIEAALSETSDCQIDISTHAGTGTLFYRKVTSGATPVFTFDWWQNPGHTQEWYDKKRNIAEMEGTLHIFEREINRNAFASVESVVINAIWVSATRRHEVKLDGRKILGFDVADDGSDAKAIAICYGNILKHVEEWVAGDVEDAADIAFERALEYGVDEIHYDSVGVGAGAKVKLRQLITARGKNIKLIGWNSGGGIVRPNSSDFNDEKNEVLFENAKSQAYWKIREEFLQTYRYVEKKECDESKIIYFDVDSTNKWFTKFLGELSQPRHKLSSRGKILIDKKADGRSPNLCEAYLLARAEKYISMSVWDT